MLKHLPYRHGGMNVPAEDGRLLYDIILDKGYKKGLEIGGNKLVDKSKDNQLDSEIAKRLDDLFGEGDTLSDDENIFEAKDTVAEEKKSQEKQPLAADDEIVDFWADVSKIKKEINNLLNQKANLWNELFSEEKKLDEIIEGGREQLFEPLINE